VHLPVQSGSTKVLAGMNRLYTRDDYMCRIEWLKAARRNYAISTDIIVGFPGETEEDFEQTLSLLDAVEYDSLFSFKYSPRPTPPRSPWAARLPMRRSSGGWSSSRRSSAPFRSGRNAMLIGGIREVLVEARKPGARPVDRPDLR